MSSIHSAQKQCIDLEARAPLLSHLLNVVVNSSTIPACGRTAAYLYKGIEALDRSQQAFYLMGCFQHWLALVLDLFDAVLAVLLVAIALLVPNGSTGVLGVALFNVMTLSSAFHRLITEWTGVEIALTAIKRVQLYVSQVQDENQADEDFEPPEDWPVKGSIELNNLSMSYLVPTRPIIQNLSVKIAAGTKVAVRGRTSSGKSSLVAGLLRMLEIIEGRIYIDGIEITRVPRQTIRGRVTTVPQEACLFPGKTVRENLSPTSSARDEELIQALQSVQLWDLVETRQGLDEELSEDTLSFGQRQLFCLARALIRPCKIVLLDEVASNADADGDSMVQKAIQGAFSDCTVFNVVHKVEAVVGHDQVLVLEEGRLIEACDPRALLQTPSSTFRVLLRGRGPCLNSTTGVRD